MIALDWGTSNFRAFRLGADGALRERRSSPDGVLQIRSGDFGAALLAQVGDWLVDGERQVLLCGMVGSRLGWMEADYLPCPAGLEEIGTALLTVLFAEAELLLVPGVMAADRDGVPEVMRGEETQAMGLLDACAGEGLLCLPGTHSKWVRLRSDRIESFLTCMTGDVFSALRSGTILGRTMTADAATDGTAFLQGVARSGETGGLLHQVFGVRSLSLFGRLADDVSASYLSGLLIGHEVRSAMPPSAQVHVAGAAHLCQLYAAAIRACGGSVVLHKEDVTIRGLAAIGRKLSWISKVE